MVCLNESELANLAKCVLYLCEYYIGNPYLLCYVVSIHEVMLGVNCLRYKCVDNY